MFKLFESLEPRVLLSHAALDTQVFYPEGFVHENVVEVVSLSNPGTEPTEYELIAHYEIGERDQVLASGVLAAGESLDVNIAGEGERLVRPNEPFALEVRSESEVGAILHHDDFGGSTQAPFEDGPVVGWALPMVTKDADTFEFIVFYNPTSESGTITVTGVDAQANEFVFVSTIEAERRGGWNLRNEISMPDGVFSVTVMSTVPIFTAQSHYVPETGDAFTRMGDRITDDPPPPPPPSGEFSGVILDLEFSNDNLRGLGSRNFGEVGETTISIINDGETGANVELAFFNRNEAEPLENSRRMVEVAAGAQVDFALSSFGFPVEANLALVYESDQAVSVGAEVSWKNKLFHIEATQEVATHWILSNSTLNQIQNGVIRNEELLVFNPTDEVVEIEVEFVRANGESYSEFMMLEPLEFGEIDTTRLPPSWGSGQPYQTVNVTSVAPVLFGLEYWARENRVVFELTNLASGDIVDLSSVLVL